MMSQKRAVEGGNDVSNDDTDDDYVNDLEGQSSSIM